MEADVNAGDGFVQIKSGATTVIKSNAAATAAPGVTDDTNAGYAVGSVWIDTTNDKAYVCLDASAGAAVWTETTQAGGAGGAVTFEGGQTTEATTTSTVPVDLLSSDTLSIATTLPVEFFVAMRKTSGAAAVGAIGLKVNTTVTGEATDGDPITLARTGSTNAASSRYAWGVLGPRITLYSDSSFVQRTADGVDTVSLGGLLHNTADLPEATITAIVIRGKVSSASITLGADELDVYSRSAA